MSKLDNQKQLKFWEAKKNNLFLRVQQTFDLIPDLNTNEKAKSQFLTRLRSIEETKSQFDKAVDKVNEYILLMENDQEPDFQSLNAFFDLYEVIKETAENLNDTTESASKELSVKAKIKLPTLDLVEFTGEDPADWPIFYHSFRTSVHENPNLSDSDRIRFLLSKLKKRALCVASGILPRAENYSIIWNTLVEKYEDKRSLANTYLKQILDFKPLGSESENNMELISQKIIAPSKALKALGLPDVADFILLHLALSKLAPTTIKQFESEIKAEIISTFAQLESFIKSHSKVLSLCSSTGKNSMDTLYKPIGKLTHRSLVVSNPSSLNLNKTRSCIVCAQRSHQLLYFCPKFKSKSAFERFKIAKDKNLCLNCLSQLHKVSACKSTKRCTHCSAKHHSLIHYMNPSSDTSGRPQVTTENVARTVSLPQCSSALSASCASRSSTAVLLSTAVVNVVDGLNNPHRVRILLDSGSQANFVTADCCRRLKLSKVRVNSTVKGIGRASQTIKYSTSLTFSSRFDPEKHFTVDAWVMDQVTDNLPVTSCIISNFNYLKDLPLADENFNTPGEIDMLVGAELFPYLIGSAKVTGPPNAPIAIQTSLGYVVMGKVESRAVNGSENFLHTFCSTVNESLEHVVKQFFELEDVPNLEKSLLSQDDLYCEKLFRRSTRREDGRYSVALPFKESPTILGDSKNLCLRRFMALEKRFCTKPDLRTEYCNVIRDFISKGYLVEWNTVDKVGYFLPHHGVIKPDSTSTRLRVVTDASAKTDTNISLNDMLHSGPKLHKDIVSILLNFRLYAVAMVSDVAQMFPQILVHPEFWKFQKILWRFSPSEDIKTFAFTRITFGLKPSPYLALRTIEQLRLDEGSKFTAAAEVVGRDFFMDDLATSIPSEGEALVLYQQLIDIFHSAGFDLVKWSTNSNMILNAIPSNLRRPSHVDFSSDSNLKILGLKWSPRSDMFSFKTIATDNKCTKRSLLSTLARIFDPLGFFAPVTITAKIMIKELWSLKLGWEDPPPDKLVQIWNKFKSQLTLLTNISIPRHTLVQPSSSIDLIGFSDASEKAMGGVVYIRCSNSHADFQVTLLCAKSRVTPKAVTSIPRLELCAALLLSRLMKIVIDTYSSRVNIRGRYAFSDASVVLHWINSTPDRWKPFVKNRVVMIQNNLPVSSWRHVSSQDNPAHCLSRGLLPNQLLNHNLWFHGPHWLKDPINEWPSVFSTTSETEEEEEKLKIFVSVESKIHPLLELTDRLSSYDKLLRVTAYVFRVQRRRSFNFLIVVASELESAELFVVKLIQEKHFCEYISLIKNSKVCPTFLRKLNPFIDPQGILRVGGRLSNSDLSYQQIHPILLPKTDTFVNMLIDKYHQSNFHTGPNLVWSLISQRFWIVGGRDLIRRRLRKCNFCFWFRPKPIPPLMGNLPPERVLEAKPFLHTGVDYAGPISVSMIRRRGVCPQKAYLCLFICLCTKAVHLELASDLSTSTFLNALKRFISRRGPVATIYSDCGTNFIGAKTHLKDLYELLESADYVAQTEIELANHRVEMKQIAASAPHWGGIWESNVKSAKSHILKVIGDQIFTFEELSTLFAQVESLLNSRPLTVKSSDPSDLQPLTPAHFLHQQPVNHLLARDLSKSNINSLSRYELLSKLVQDFWKRWHLEYLHTLQARAKWNTATNPVAIGTIVVVQRDNIPPFSWPLGIIEEVYPGKDGIPRVALVRTRGTVLKRPVIKLCPLPLQ